MFAAACCRRAWHLLDADARAVIEASERLADGSATEGKLMAAVWASRGCEGIDARAAVDHAAAGAWWPAAALLAALCGRPRPFIATSVLAWYDGVVTRLAQAAYDERDLPGGHLDVQRLAVLADALEESSCTDAPLLGHLRGEGPHWRGCWALDGVTGKS